MRPPGWEAGMRKWVVLAVLAAAVHCAVGGSAESIANGITLDEIKAFEANSSAVSPNLSETASAQCDPAYCILDAFGQLGSEKVEHLGIETSLVLDRDTIFDAGCVTRDDRRCLNDPMQTAVVVMLVLSPLKQAPDSFGNDR